MDHAGADNGPACDAERCRVGVLAAASTSWHTRHSDAGSCHALEGPLRTRSQFKFARVIMPNITQICLCAVRLELQLIDPYGAENTPNRSYCSSPVEKARHDGTEALLVDRHSRS